MSELRDSSPRMVVPPEVDHLIDAFAEEAGVGAGTVARRVDSDRLGASEHAAARLESGRQVVLIHPLLLGAPHPVRRQVLAHEIAHIALNHTTRAGLLRRLSPFLLAGLLALTLIAAEAAQVATPRWRLILLLVLAGILVAGWQLFLACARQREYQADEFAAVRLGAPFNDEVADFVTATAPATSGWRRFWRRTHPSPQRRRARVARRLAAQTPEG